MFMDWLTVAGADLERIGCGHREEVVESTISLPLHTVGTGGALTEARKKRKDKGISFCCQMVEKPFLKTNNAALYIVTLFHYI